MEPSSTPLPWASSAGIDEGTLQELFDMDIFSNKEPQVPDTLDEDFFNAYMAELRGRKLSLTDPMTTPQTSLTPPANVGAWTLPPTAGLTPPLPPLQTHATFPPSLPGSMDAEFSAGEQIVGPVAFDATATFRRTISEGRKKRLRTPQQQELNKLAQQRYRERRKQKYSDLEAEVDDMRAELDGLRQVESKNVELEMRNKFLEKLVAMQQEEIALLKSQLLLPVRESSQTAGSSEAHSRPKKPEELNQELETHVRALKQFLESNNISRGDAPVSDGSRQLVGKIVAAVCEAQVHLTVMTPPEVGESLDGSQDSEDEVILVSKPQVVDRDVQSVKKVQLMDQLKPCIESMHLTENQQATLLHMRADHLTRMRGLYEERQKLNMKAMSLMLHHPLHEKGGKYDPSVDGKMNCMGRAGYRDCNKGEDMLKVVLENVKENLQTEQRNYLELQVSMLQSILNPIQAAMFIVHWHPELVDALAFCNTLQALQGHPSLDV